jgi:hypothetical protein
MLPFRVLEFALLRERCRIDRAEDEGKDNSELLAVLGRVGFEEERVGVGDDVLWLKVERGHVAAAGSPRVADDVVGGEIE